jgi:hypothetical protein
MQCICCAAEQIYSIPNAMYLFSRIVGKVGAEGYLRGFWGRFVSILADYCMAIQCFGYFGYTQKLFYFNNRSPLAFLGGDNNPKLISITCPSPLDCHAFPRQYLNRCLEYPGCKLLYTMLQSV